jgi:hypothetical protein
MARPTHQRFQGFIGGDRGTPLFDRRDDLDHVSLADLMDAFAGPSLCHFAAKQPRNLGPGAVLREALVDKSLKQILDAIRNYPALDLSLLGRRIASLESRGEYLLCCHAGLVQGDASYGPMVYLRNFDPAPPARYKTMNTLRPFGVTLTPKPGRVASQ